MTKEKQQQAQLVRSPALGEEERRENAEKRLYSEA
jgi:hypothetical protein